MEIYIVNERKESIKVLKKILKSQEGSGAGETRLKKGLKKSLKDLWKKYGKI
jgi:hypothetical protein